MESGFKAFAVLPAAGSGERMHLPTPKQYCSIENRPLISHTLESFERVPWIVHTVVTVSPTRSEDMSNIIADYGHSDVEVVDGGATRHRSIYSGVRALKKVCEPHDVVIIHDAVRPFVDEDILSAVALAAKEYGASGAVRPLVSTVLAADGEGFLDHSLERAKYRASEMPQAFRYDVIATAYEKCTEYDFDFGTECLHLAQRYTDTRVKLLEGPINLWKVTHKKDIYAAEGLLKESKVVSILGCQDKSTELFLCKAIASKGMQVLEPGATPRKTTSDGISGFPPDFIIFNDSLAFVKDNLHQNLTKASLRYPKSLVLILPAEKDPSGEFCSLVEGAARKAKRENLNVCVNGVLVGDLKCSEEVPTVAASLVFDCNMLYSGQVFHL